MSKEEKVFNGEEGVNTISESKKGFLIWIKLHKKQLVLAGISITAIVGIILGIKNKKVLMKLQASLTKKIKEVSTDNLIVDQSSISALETITPVEIYTLPKEPFNVRRHIRTLPIGCYHSPEKAVEADALGIKLLPNQTLVNSYTKCAA